MLGNALSNLERGWGEGRGLNGVIVVAPSEHEKREGRYQWQRTGPVPAMPGYLASQLPDVMEAADAATDAEVAAFLAECRHSERPELLDIHIAAWQKKLATGESRHNSMLGHISGALKEAKAGLIDAQLAADTLQGIFETAVMAEPVGPKQGKSRSPSRPVTSGTGYWPGQWRRPVSLTLRRLVSGPIGRPTHFRASGTGLRRTASSATPGRKSATSRLTGQPRLRAAYG
jgi:hypothetical protein